jgi:hypothetical protein
MSDISVGDALEWRWGNSAASGQVVKGFTGDVARSIKENEGKRTYDAELAAYLIEQDDGDRVLKSHSKASATS